MRRVTALMTMHSEVVPNTEIGPYLAFQRYSVVSCRDQPQGESAVKMPLVKAAELELIALSRLSQQYHPPYPQTAHFLGLRVMKRLFSVM